MKDQIISFEVAKELKEKGFDEECNFYYDIETPSNLLEFNYFHYDRSYSTFCGYPDDVLYFAPTQSLLQRWLRESHNLSVEVHVGQNSWEVEVFSVNDFSVMYSSGVIFKTYEEALESGLKHALTLIK